MKPYSEDHQEMEKQRRHKLYCNNVVVYKYVNSLANTVQQKLLTESQVDDIAKLTKWLLEEQSFEPQYMQEPPVKHNHITRDIKELGKCPGCDAYIYHKAKEDL